MHSVRIVYDAWVPADAPAPRVVEVDGSTVDARWHPLADVGVGPRPDRADGARGARPPPTRRGEAAAGGLRLVLRGDAVLLTRNSAPRSPTGDLDPAGRRGGPRRAACRRGGARGAGGDGPAGLRSERLLGVHDEHFTGIAPHGREEDSTGWHLVSRATVPRGEPEVRETDGTTDAVAWVPASSRLPRTVPVAEVATAALGMRTGSIDYPLKKRGRIHLRRSRAQVRSGRLRRDPLRPRPAGRAARAGGVTDPGVAATGRPERIAGQLARGRTAWRRRSTTACAVEPTDESLCDAAAEYARATGPWDAHVAVGGGSSIDTAKAVNLLITNDGDLMDYLNAPVGTGRAPAHPLQPLVAVPTTTGTGARATTMCVLDIAWPSRSRRASAIRGCARPWPSSTPSSR